MPVVKYWCRSDVRYRISYKNRHMLRLAVLRRQGTLTRLQKTRQSILRVALAARKARQTMLAVLLMLLGNSLPRRLMPRLLAPIVLVRRQLQAAVVCAANILDANGDNPPSSSRRMAYLPRHR